MKKVIFLALGIVLCIQAIEHPLKGWIGSLEGLPIELHRAILHLEAEHDDILNIEALARGIVRLAGTNKLLREQINTLPNIVTILNSLPKSAAPYLVVKLAKMPVIQENMLTILQTLSKPGAIYVSRALAGFRLGIEKSEIKKWLETIKLEHGKELFDAVKDKNLEQIKKLLENPNLDIDWHTSFYEGEDTALIEAVDHNRKDIVQMLLKAGANPNIHNRRETALTIAAKKNNAEIVRMLLNAGAGPDKRGPGNSTALMAAVGRCAINAIKILLDVEARTDLMDMNRHSAFDYLHEAFGSNYPLEERKKVEELLTEASSKQKKKRE